VPTNDEGSNSNLDSDGKCAGVFVPVEAMEARQGLNEITSSKTSSTSCGRKCRSSRTLRKAQVCRGLW